MATNQRKQSLPAPKNYWGVVATKRPGQEEAAAARKAQEEEAAAAAAAAREAQEEAEAAAAAAAAVRKAQEEAEAAAAAVSKAQESKAQEEAAAAARKGAEEGTSLAPHILRSPAAASPGSEREPTLREWLQEGPYTLCMSSSFFGFYAHLGVLTALVDAGVGPAKLTGSSAGALIASVYGSGVDLGEAKRALLGLRRDDVLCGWLDTGSSPISQVIEVSMSGFQGRNSGSST